MKYLFFILSFLILNLNAQHSLGMIDDFYCPCLEEKAYLNPEDVSVNDQGIILHLNEGQIPIETLYSDANGLFITLNKDLTRSWITYLAMHRL